MLEAEMHYHNKMNLLFPNTPKVSKEDKVDLYFDVVIKS